MSLQKVPNQQRNLKKNKFVVCILSATGEKSRIRAKMSRIHNTSLEQFARQWSPMLRVRTIVPVEFAWIRIDLAILDPDSH
jgi:hypothetical protein